MTQLSRAAAEQNVEEVKEILERGANPNEKDYYSNSMSPLQECALNGNLEITKLLVQAGGNLEDDYLGNNVLHNAVREQNGDLALWMLQEAKADPYALNGFGNNLLHLAALYGQFQVVKYLCDEKKMNPNEPNQSGATPMQCAFAGGQVEIIRYFTVKSNKMLLSESSPQEMNYHLAKKFLRDANSKVSTLSFSNVCFISTQHFLEAGCIPIHEECVQKEWIRDGTAIKAGSKVLFISHRWQTAHAPDPDNVQYNIVKKFILSNKHSYDYVWADYSCITQDKSSPLFGVHLANIPTALFCATHCIVVPAVHENDASDLVDYLGRGWCQLEAMVAIFTGCETYVTFKIGDDYEEFPKLEPFRGFSLPGGFRLSTENAQQNLEPSLKRIARRFWGKTTEPVANMKEFVDGCIVIHKDHPDIFEKILTMEIEHEDILRFDNSHNNFLRSLPNAYRNLGNFTSEDDRVIVARLLLFCMAFSMYEFDVTEVEPIENGTTKEVESIENGSTKEVESAAPLEKENKRDAPISTQGPQEKENNSSVVVADKKGCCITM